MLPNILVTRPEPQNQSLVNKLRDLGWSATGQPLIEITQGGELELLSHKLAQLRPQDMVIAVSANAVSYAHQQLQQERIAWPNQVNYFAIGQKTTQAWSGQAGIVSIHPEQPDSEGLLQLPVFSKVRNKQVLILRGNGGRETIASQLGQRGAKIQYCETYQRIKTTLNGDILTLNWQQSGINNAIITSGEILGALLYLIPTSAKAWFEQVQLVVPSERIAKLAKQQGLNKVQVAEGASDQALIACLQKLNKKIGQV